MSGWVFKSTAELTTIRFADFHPRPGCRQESLHRIWLVDCPKHSLCSTLEKILQTRCAAWNPFFSMLWIFFGPQTLSTPSPLLWALSAIGKTAYELEVRYPTCTTKGVASQRRLLGVLSHHLKCEMKNFQGSLIPSTQERLQMKIWGFILAFAS